MKQNLFELPEVIRQKDYIVASYYIRLKADENVYEKAERLAIGQTIGTWVKVPGITSEIEDTYCGRVVQIIDVPSVDLTTQLQEECDYIIKIGYPIRNFGGDFPLMLTALLGNDASTSAQVKLLDIEMPDALLKEFGGPTYGLEGIRELTGVYERPLTLNMIKPCLGLSPEEGAKIFYETALGGVDVIKDDELLGNPSYSKPEDRVREFKKAAKRAYEITGKETKYFVNVTGGVGDMYDCISRVKEAGADGIMINYTFIGYSTVMDIKRKFNMPILGHGAGSGAYSEGVQSGMSTPLCAGKLPRVAGVDLAMINTPYGGYPLTHGKYMQTHLNLSRPYGVKPSMTIIGGGVHPGMVPKYISEVGTDVMLAAGGAVQGHPMGSAAGVKAMHQAIDATMKNIAIEEAAKEHEELAVALERFGIGK